jgi:hypothetical protein
MITPAVVIDGDVKLVGKVPDKKDIRKWGRVPKLLNRNSKR